MALDPKSEQAFHDALDVINHAKFAASGAEERERLREEEERLFAAREREIEGDLAARTYYFNFIAARLSAVNAALGGDALGGVRAKIRGRLLEMRAHLMDSATELMTGLEERLIPDELDDERADPGAVAEAPSPKTGADEAALAAGEAAVPVVPAPANPPAAEPDSKVRADLGAEYESLFAECVIRPDRLGSVNWHIARLKANRGRYEAAGGPAGVPWWFIGGIHMLETGFTFDRHLHNGDPLAAPTVRVPAGRPPGASGPFSWEASAADAIACQELDGWGDWSVAGALYQWERYNGFGYRNRHPEVRTPYLWSFTNHYAKGKYVRDGQFDPDAVSRQCGAAAMLRALVNRGLVAV